MPYVDGYVIPVPKKMLETYFRMARKAAKVFIEHGAIEYKECAGDDLNPKGMTTFPKTINVKPGETVVFSWIIFKSRAHRDKVNAKVVKDPRIAPLIGASATLFNPKRMVYGGFKMMVNY